MNDRSSWLVLISASGMFILAVGIILFVILYQRRVINHQIQLREFNRQKQLELMQAAIRSEEDERMRIAAELHDDVGATLSSIRLFLSQALRMPDNTDLIIQSKELLDNSIQKIRDLSHQLQPAMLQYLGLAKALQSFCVILSRSGGIHAHFEEGSDAWTEPEPHASLAIYRIVQELVNNIIKHADASWIKLSVTLVNGRHCLSLLHNGAGLTEEMYHTELFKSEATGLKNIENRLKSAALDLIFHESLPGTSNLSIVLPAPQVQTSL